MKKLGVIGGLGSKATAYFFNQLVDMTDAVSDQEHIEVIIHNHPQIPDRTSYILGKSDLNPMPVLLEDTNKLLAMGCDAIYVPCNTAHYFINQFDQELKGRFIHMIEETVREVQKRNQKKVLLLATSGTVETKLYQKAFEDVDIECVILESSLQTQLMSLIYDKIKAGKSADDKDVEPFFHFAQKMNVESVILGCTELSILKGELKLSAFYIDAMECAIKACIVEMDKKIRIQ